MHIPSWGKQGIRGSLGPSAWDVLPQDIDSCMAWRPEGLGRHGTNV